MQKILGDYFRVPADQRDLNYEKYIEDGNTKVVEYEVIIIHTIRYV